MRKIRTATLVAAMIGTLSLAGAGVASAADYDGGKDDGGRNCVQGADQSDNNPSVTVGLLNLGDLFANKSEQNTIQQTCINGDGSGAWTGSGQGNDQYVDGLLDLLTLGG